MENILDIFQYDRQQNAYSSTNQYDEQQNAESAQKQQNVEIKATWRSLQSYVKNDKLVAFNVNIMSDVMDIERSVEQRFVFLLFD